MRAKNKLGKYYQQHGRAKFLIRPWSVGENDVHTCAVFAEHARGPHVFVQGYSRQRDAKRALRDLGLVQEGRYWRVPSAAKETAEEAVKRLNERIEAEKIGGTADYHVFGLDLINLLGREE